MRHVVLLNAHTVLLLFSLLPVVLSFSSLESSSSSSSSRVFRYRRPTSSLVVLLQQMSSSSEYRSLARNEHNSSSLWANTTGAMPKSSSSPPPPPVVAAATSTTTTTSSNNALDYFLQTIRNLQQQQAQGDEASIYLVETMDAPPPPPQQQQQQYIVSINSLVFEIIQLEGEETLTLEGNIIRLADYSYVLAVLPSNQRVQVKALEQAVQDFCTRTCSANKDDGDDDDDDDDDNDDSNTANTCRVRLQLCPAERVETLCGFAPRKVPPIGHMFPCLTVVEESLLRVRHAYRAALDDDDDDDDDDSTTSILLLQGGGGQLGMSCRLSLQMLLEAQPDRTCVASFGTDDDAAAAAAAATKNKSQSTFKTTETASSSRTLLYPPPPKPFFAVKPPNTELAQTILQQQQKQQQQQWSSSSLPVDTARIPPPQQQQLQPVPVTVFGRIARIRRMARRLVFADLVPPDTDDDFTSDNKIDNDDPFPWACPGQESRDMAVQLIAGKTLCETMGEAALRQLRPQQLVLVQGRTAVASRDSLQNWVDQKCLDIIVVSYQILREVAAPTTVWSSSATNSVLGTRRHTARIVADDDKDDDDLPTYHDYLRMNDLYPVAVNDDTVAASRVILVDSKDSVEQFGKDLSDLLVSLTTAQIQKEDESILQFGLVGIDCEWRPSFYLSSSREQQPVLLLQICLHPMQKIYLFDLQSLLRPMLLPKESPNVLETLVSECLMNLMRSTRLIKVGFQLGNDLQRLAASYPNIPAFQNVHSVLEVSALARKVMHMNRKGNSRTATSSLSRLSEAFLDKTLNKEQQCSDWAKRPLLMEQIEYAALDAVVTPVIVEKLLHSVHATFFDKPRMGRWAEDSKFATQLTSSRFFFLGAETDVTTIRKLNAKRVVGDQFVVTQNWITGEKSPQAPCVPADGSNGPYTDRRGILRYPSKLVSFTDRKALHVLLDDLVGQFIGRSKDRCLAPFVTGRIPEGSQLDFPPRSGYIDTKDIVFLFVNMPSYPGRGQPLIYPNEWLDDGRSLTWFMRKNDWQGGTTDIAQKLKNTDEANTVVVLFVRVGKAPFLCCGRCRVLPVDQEDFTEAERQTLVELKLLLLDWQELQKCQHFQDLVKPEADDY